MISVSTCRQILCVIKHGNVDNVSISMFWHLVMMLSYNLFGEYAEFRLIFSKQLHQHSSNHALIICSYQPRVERSTIVRYIDQLVVQVCNHRITGSSLDSMQVGLTSAQSRDGSADVGPSVVPINISILLSGVRSWQIILFDTNPSLIPVSI